MLLQLWRLCSLWVAPDQIDYSWHAQFIWLHCPPTLLLLLVSEMCIFCVCVCARAYVCVMSKRQFHPRSYSVEQVMILLLTYVLITLFVMSVHFFLCLFVCVFWCRHSNDCSNRFIFMYCTTVCPYCVLSLCMCMWLFVCMHVCMSTAVCMSVCGCVWMCLFVCVSCVCARVGK